MKIVICVIVFVLLLPVCLAAQTDDNCRRLAIFAVITSLSL
jgi:hypothetical protein